MQNISSQALNVKNLYGQDVDINKIIGESSKKQPTLLVLWADAFCGSPCYGVMDGINNEYNTLKNKYNLKVITLNVDGISGKDDKNFLDAINRRYSNEIGTSSTYYEFTRKNPKIKHLPFDKYSDDDANFTKALKITSTPITMLFIDEKSVFTMIGWQRLKTLDSLGVNTKGYTRDTQTVGLILKSIMQGVYGTEAYLDKNKNYTLKQFNPTYRRNKVKIGDHYEITDALMSGDIYKKTITKDIAGFIPDGITTFYNKDGIIEETRTYKNAIEDGPSVQYYKNGKISFEGNISNGYWDGVWKGYYSNGKPRVENVWDKGKLMNVNYYYAPDGKKLDKGTLKDGNGTRITYDLDGKYKETANYKDGIKQKKEEKK